MRLPAAAAMTWGGAADRGRCGTGVVQDDYFGRRLVGRLGHAGPPSLGNVRSQHGASIFRFFEERMERMMIV